MLTLKDIQHVFDALLELGLNFRFGYAGSYAKGVGFHVVQVDGSSLQSGTGEG